MSQSHGNVGLILHLRVQLQLQLEALGQCIPQPRHVLPVSRYPDQDPWSGSPSPPKFNHLFTGQLPTFTENPCKSARKFLRSC